MADFYTTSSEEILIDQIRKDGLGFNKDSEFPKYHILRIALTLALHLPQIPLNSKDWEQKDLKGERGKEYHLAQLTGKGSKKEDDYDNLLRALLTIKHKKEFNDYKINIFDNHEKYLEILSRYIKRGLYEIKQTWKIKDCFYQWSLDYLGLDYLSENTIKKDIAPLQPEELSMRIKEVFKKSGIKLDIVNTKDSYRHTIYRVEISDINKLEAFKKNSKNLDEALGVQNIYIQSCKEYGLPKMYDIKVSKPENEWQKLGKKDFKEGLNQLNTKYKEYKLGIFAGFDTSREAFCFDLASIPHIFVAGTTGGGKTVFLQSIILSLLNSTDNIKITIIDPKAGSFNNFESCKKIELIKDMSLIEDKLDSIIQDMENRFQKLDAHNTRNIQDLNIPFQVLIIDELNDLTMCNKTIDEKLTRLAQKAREAGIHLVLGTQRPDSKTFTGGIRSNIPGRIALKVTKLTESRIILDEKGAEKLLGKGDMLIKLPSKESSRHVFGTYLAPSDIKDFLPSS